MRRLWLRSASVLALTALAWGRAHAEIVPEGITEWLKTTNARLVMLHQRVLYVSYRVPLVDEAFFAQAVQGLCTAPERDGRYGWSGAQVEEIQILNEDITQGVALAGGEVSCPELALTATPEGEALLRERMRWVRIEPRIDAVSF